jgi:hypothetical protein
LGVEQPQPPQTGGTPVAVRTTYRLERFSSLRQLGRVAPAGPRAPVGAERFLPWTPKKQTLALTDACIRGSVG